MDVSGINWAVAALGVLAFLFLVWFFVARRARAGLAAGFVSLALLIAAGLNSAAPIRGYLDPEYVGYGFGFAQADAGLAVTIVAGAVWLLAVAASFLALARHRAAMLFVMLVCGLFAVNLGYPMIRDQLAAGDQPIQLTEGIVLPSVAVTAASLLLVVGPFAFGALWAALRTVRPREA